VKPRRQPSSRSTAVFHSQLKPFAGHSRRHSGGSSSRGSGSRGMVRSPSQSLLPIDERSASHGDENEEDTDSEPDAQQGDTRTPSESTTDSPLPDELHGASAKSSRRRPATYGHSRSQSAHRWNHADHEAASSSSSIDLQHMHGAGAGTAVSSTSGSEDTDGVRASNTGSSSWTVRVEDTSADRHSD